MFVTLSFLIGSVLSLAQHCLCRAGLGPAPAKLSWLSGTQAWTWSGTRGVKNEGERIICVYKSSPGSFP